MFDANGTSLPLGELLREVRRIGIHSSRLVDGVMAGTYRSVFRGTGVEFDEVREYVAGDDPRAVDWNVTARTGRPFVKTYVDERELTVVFVLDLSASMGAGFGGLSPQHAAAQVCACLGLSAAKNNDKVGLVAFADRVVKYVAPRKGSQHSLRIVRDSLELPLVQGETDAAAALDFTARTLRRRSVVFVISDFFVSGWERAMKRCARRHDVVAVRMLSPELAPLDAGVVRLADAETGAYATLDWTSRAVRDEYARRVERWRTQTEESLRRIGVDRLDIELLADARAAVVSRPILEFFRMRELRGGRR